MTTGPITLKQTRAKLVKKMELARQLACWIALEALDAELKSLEDKLRGEKK
jgi:hypothetical protein